MKTNNGGPAFPNPALADPSFSPMCDVSGMSLRDWFAGQALAGISSHVQPSIGPRMDTEKLCKACATYAYAIANAMLAERDRLKEGE